MSEYTLTHILPGHPYPMDEADSVAEGYLAKVRVIIQPDADQPKTKFKRGIARTFATVAEAEEFITKVACEWDGRGRLEFAVNKYPKVHKEFNPNILDGRSTKSSPDIWTVIAEGPHRIKVEGGIMIPNPVTVSLSTP